MSAIRIIDRRIKKRSHRPTIDVRMCANSDTSAKVRLRCGHWFGYTELEPGGLVKGHRKDLYSHSNIWARRQEDLSHLASAHECHRQSPYPTPEASSARTPAGQ